MSGRFFSYRKLGPYAIGAMISLTNVTFATPHATSPKEALMLRRITEYWKDGDYTTVKRQIEYFLEKNPETGLHDHLHAMLGDLYFQERNFRQALATYDLIGDAEVRSKTFFNYLQALFEMRDYLLVIDKAEQHVKDHRGAEDARLVKIRYLLAESCFRQALKSQEMGEKILYLKMAKPHYKILTQTKFSDRALFPLAEIHRLLREDARAAALYLNLAQKYPEHRERFLFQAGILQIKDNKKEAIESFFQVYEMGDKRSILAAFNQLILLYQTEKYEEFLAFFPKVIAKMPEQKSALLQFYEGRCHYYLGDYEHAVLPLETFVTKAPGRSKELKSALLLLVNCSRYIKDVSLLERTLFSYKSTFPNDIEVPKVLMIHAQMCREQGNFAQALSDLKILSTEYPAFEDRESVMYDHALMLSQTDQWMEAREKFLTFLNTFPSSERKNVAWRHLLNCCIEELKNPSHESSNETKDTFVKILDQALHEDKLLNEREQQQYTLVMIKCLCELHRYEKAMPMLSTYITDVLDPGFLAEAHLMIAICHQKLENNLSLFIDHAEKALGYNPKLLENKILHLELYNAYLAKGFTTEDIKNKKHFFNSAANHLFASNAWKERSIKLDNYLWLANHYFQVAKHGDTTDFERARLIFKNLLGIEDGKSTLNISSDSLYLENEVLKFAHLLEINKEHKDRITILEMLVRKQEENEKLPWKLKNRTVLELAKAYDQDGNYQDALRSYKFLTKNKDQASSVVINTASLHLAKLEYRLLKTQQRSSDSPEMISILHTLKDLQIQKKLLSEPLHLESALEYAEIRSRLSDGNAKNAMFFYQRMLDDFHASEDSISEAYNHLREQHPGKNAIFTAYMRYLDAQIIRYEGQIAREESKHSKALQCKEDALFILDELLENPIPLQPYLLDRIKRAKIEITKQL